MTSLQEDFDKTLVVVVLRVAARDRVQIVHVSRRIEVVTFPNHVTLDEQPPVVETDEVTAVLDVDTSRYSGRELDHVGHR